MEPVKERSEGPRLVLASASPRRAELLRDYQPVVHPSDAREQPPGSQPAPQLTTTNARLKAEPVSALYPDHLVVGVDTLVVLDGEAMGKPTDLADAFAMLSRLNGRIHEVCSGVCLAHRKSGSLMTFHEVTHVKFRPLTDGGIRAYLNKIDPMDKAGAYAAQEHGEDIIERMEGSRSNVIGLPMERFREALDRMRRHVAGI